MAGRAFCRIVVTGSPVAIPRLKVGTPAVPNDSSQKLVCSIFPPKVKRCLPFTQLRLFDSSNTGLLRINGVMLPLVGMSVAMIGVLLPDWLGTMRTLFPY